MVDLERVGILLHIVESLVGHPKLASIQGLAQIELDAIEVDAAKELSEVREAKAKEAAEAEAKKVAEVKARFEQEGRLRQEEAKRLEEGRVREDMSRLRVRPPDAAEARRD